MACAACSRISGYAHRNMRDHYWGAAAAIARLSRRYAANLEAEYNTIQARVMDGLMQRRKRRSAADAMTSYFAAI